MSFLVSFEVVEIIFFFLDLELESFSSSRFLFWEATGKAGVDSRLECCRGGAGGGEGGGAGGAAAAGGGGAATAVACTACIMSFSFLIFRSRFSSSCHHRNTIQDRIREVPVHKICSENKPLLSVHTAQSSVVECSGGA